MQSFTIIRNVIICQRMFGQFSTDRFSESAFPNDLLANRIGCIDGTDRLLRRKAKTYMTTTLTAGNSDFWDAKPAQTMVTTHGVTGC